MDLILIFIWFAAKDKRCRAYGWDHNQMICASQQIIKNEELAKMAIFKKSGWKDGMIMGAWTNSHDLLMPFNFSLVSFFYNVDKAQFKR